MFQTDVGVLEIKQNSSYKQNYTYNILFIQKLIKKLLNQIMFNS